MILIISHSTMSSIVRDLNSPKFPLKDYIMIKEFTCISNTDVPVIATSSEAESSFYTVVGFGVERVSPSNRNDSDCADTNSSGFVGGQGMFASCCNCKSSSF